jgi:hypothetical protein
VNHLRQAWASRIKIAVEGYRGLHQPSQGPPAYDLLEGDMMPDDVYDHPEWYTGYTDRVILGETMRALRSARGKPNAVVTIYRGAPAGTKSINTGDWVTLSKQYALQHGLDG